MASLEYFFVNTKQNAVFNSYGAIIVEKIIKPTC
jgi:hypothetical protein